MLINEAIFSFVDVETTGMSPASGGRVVEVAVLSVRPDGEEEFSSLLNPQTPIPPEVTAIHGITNDMVRASPVFRQIAPSLGARLENTVVVCHNADFDVPFLAYEFGLSGLRLPPIMILDTLRLARKNGGYKSNKLGSLAAAMGCSTEGWHRALADVRMTRHVFNHFVALFREHGAQTVEDLSELQVKKLKDYFPAAGKGDL